MVSIKNNKGVSDWYKNEKSEDWSIHVCDWSIHVCGKAGELAACLTRERVFPENAEVNTPGGFSISAIPKQHLCDYVLVE